MCIRDSLRAGAQSIFQHIPYRLSVHLHHDNPVVKRTNCGSITAVYHSLIKAGPDSAAIDHSNRSARHLSDAVRHKIADFRLFPSGIDVYKRQDFKEKKAMFTGVWEESFVLPDELGNAGIMYPAAIARQRNSILCEQRLSNVTLAAAFGDSSLYYACVEQNQKEVLKGTAEDYSYRMLPLLGSEGNHPWFMFAPSALMGVNNAISEEKQEACKRIVDLLSTPEGQAALIGYIHANWGFLLLFGLLALFAALDFNTFWTNFHRVFFTNDLWLLDPRTDILIQMVPGQFFFDLVMRIAFALSLIHI